ncbi:MAG: TolC family protein [Armatimonadota bacterium]
MAVFIFTAGVSASSEIREIDINRLSIKDCVDLAILGNYSFKEKREDLLEAIASLRVNKNLSQPNIQSSATMGEDTGVRTTARSITFNLLQDLNTGDQISIVNNAFTQSAGNHPYLYNQFSIQYLKPFFKNGGFAYGNYNIGTAEKSLELSKLDYEIARQDLIQDVMTAYYNVIKNKNLILVYEESVRVAEESYKMALLKKEDELSKQIDITRAEILIASSQDSLVGAKKDWKSSLDALATLIGFEPEDDIDIKYDYSRKFSIPYLKEDELIETALDKRMGLAKKNVELEQKNLDLKYYKNQYMPELNLLASYNTNPDSNNLGLSQSYLLPTWSINLNTTYYFRDFEAEEDMKTAQRQINLKLEDISSYTRTITEQVRDSMRDISTSLSKIEINAKNLKFSQKNLDLANKRWEKGLADNKDVMDAQKDVNSAKTDYYNAQIDFLISKVNLLRHMGEDLYQYLTREF